MSLLVALEQAFEWRKRSFPSVPRAQHLSPCYNLTIVNSAAGGLEHKAFLFEGIFLM